MSKNCPTGKVEYATRPEAQREVTASASNTASPYQFMAARIACSST